MSIIIISSDSDQAAQEVAQPVAETLDYDLVNRDILGDAATKNQINEKKFTQILDERLSLFKTPSKLWYRYLAYVQEATLAELIKDNAVCQGLAAHLYVLGVSHVLRIRILSDPIKQTHHLASQAGISLEKAKKFLDQEKKLRKRWSVKAFGIDETDPSQYDLVINLSKIDQDETVKIIKETISYRRFKPMTYSIKCINDIELAGRVRAALLKSFPDIRVKANSGALVIEMKGLQRKKQKRSNLIKEIAGKIPGVEYVEVHFINDFFVRR